MTPANIFSTRRLCAICNERPATKRVHFPIVILLCFRCFAQWLKDMKEDSEIIQEDIINPEWTPNQ